MVLCEIPAENICRSNTAWVGGFPQVSIKVLANVLSGQSEVPWKEVNYLVSEVTYGGRVTDEWDKRCLKALFYKFCNPEILNDNFSFSSNVVRSKLSLPNYF